MKKLLSIILSILIIFSIIPGVVIADGDISVYVTVTDISDYEEPFNVLVKRQEITVSDFDITDYGDTLQGIQTVEGTSYLHALIQLHINLYGEAEVKNKLMLTADGETKYFMGKSVANVMYKNGKDIFDLPQNVPITDGDEIQVCLYDEGRSQAVATFDEAKILKVGIGEELTFKLQQHYGHPRDRDPIPDAEIVFSDGRYVTDYENGGIIKTDCNGEFTVSFDEPGEYIISSMPEINYYMTDTGGFRTEYIPQEKVELVTVTREGWAPLTKSGLEQIRKEFPEAEDNPVVVFQWGDLNPEDEGVLYNKSALAEDYGGYMLHEELTGTFTEEKVTVELVPVEVYVPDELLPMISYTTPLLVIEVTDKPVISNVWLEDSTLGFTCKNADYGYNSGCDLYAVGYTEEYDEDGVFICDRMGEMHKAVTLNSKGYFDFSKVYDKYKLMVWENGTMCPASDVFVYESLVNAS